MTHPLHSHPVPFNARRRGHVQGETMSNTTNPNSTRTIWILALTLYAGTLLFGGLTLILNPTMGTFLAMFGFFVVVGGVSIATIRMLLATPSKNAPVNTTVFNN